MIISPRFQFDIKIWKMRTLLFGLNYYLSGFNILIEVYKDLEKDL